MIPSHVYLVYVKSDRTYRVFTNWTIASRWSSSVDGTIIPYVIEQPKEENVSNE
jgi:hypothetical protein